MVFAEYWLCGSKIVDIFFLKFVDGPWMPDGGRPEWDRERGADCRPEYRAGRKPVLRLEQRAVGETTSLSGACFRRIPVWRSREEASRDVLEEASRQYAAAAGGLVEASREALGCLLEDSL